MPPVDLLIEGFSSGTIGFNIAVRKGAVRDNSDIHLCQVFPTHC